MRGARTWAAAVAVAAGLLLVSAGAAETVLAHPISNDPYTNTNGDVQHKTQVEPDSFAFGNTIVAVSQSGRYVNGGGASNLVFATSQNAGRTWTTGGMPGGTVWEGGTWPRISDPSIAYDPQHDVWLFLGLGIDAGGSGHILLVDRSTDGGLTWSNPVNAGESSGSFWDKTWITCDTWAASPHYGNCYIQFDDNGQGNAMKMVTSTDGGVTWGPVRRRLFLRARRPACRPAERQRHRSLLGKRRSAVLDPLDRRRHHVGWVHAHRQRGRARRCGQHADFLAPVGRGRRGRHGSTSPGRTAGSGPAARRTTSSTAARGRADVVGRDANSDRPDEQQHRPFPARDRGRQVDFREHDPSRRWLLLLPGQQLHERHVRAHLRLRVVDRRRSYLDDRETRSRGR